MRAVNNIDFKYISGWADRPDKGVWSVERTAHATITIPELLRQTPDLEYLFHISAEVFIPPSSGHRDIEIFLGRIPVLSTTVYAAESQISFRISSEFMHAVSHSLFFVFDDPSAAFSEIDATKNMPGIQLKTISYTVHDTNHEPKHHLISAGKAYSETLFASSKPPDEVADTVASISKHILTREPFSLVRFSEGEGRILAYPQWLSAWETAHQTLTYQYGPQVLEASYRRWGFSAFAKAMGLIQKGMIQAARSANVVGLPMSMHFSAIRTMRDVQAQVGFASALLNVSNALDPPPQSNTIDCYCNHVLQRQGAFDTLLRNLPFVGTVGHSDVGEALRTRFGIQKTQHISIPAHATFLTLEGLHFPDRFESIVNTLTVPYRGAVFLVGAGYLGKLYCDLIKQRGGIALDVGSVFDGWTGRGRSEIVADPRMHL